MKHAIGPRREMGVRTLFNLLGPLTNPAGVTNQVLGVYSREWVRPLAQVLQQLGSRHVMVVHGDNGMDEISISGPTWVSELKDDSISDYQIDPGQFGLQVHPLESIQVQNAAQSLAMINAVLANQVSAAQSIILMNAGAAIYVGGAVDSIVEGIDKARSVLADGSAAQTLQRLVDVSQELGGE